MLDSFVHGSVRQAVCGRTNARCALIASVLIDVGWRVAVVGAAYDRSALRKEKLECLMDHVAALAVARLMPSRDTLSIPEHWAVQMI
jgi:hypothetical protein